MLSDFNETQPNDRRSQFRRDIDRRNDDFRVRLILTAAVVFLIGIYAGVQMEKRNAENIRSVSSVHSVADLTGVSR